MVFGHGARAGLLQQGRLPRYSNRDREKDKAKLAIEGAREKGGESGGREWWKGDLLCCVGCYPRW